MRRRGSLFPSHHDGHREGGDSDNHNRKNYIRKLKERGNLAKVIFVIILFLFGAMKVVRMKDWRPLQLTEANFQNVVDKHSIVAVLRCNTVELCRQPVPKWEKFAWEVKKRKLPVVVARVDCSPAKEGTSISTYCSGIQYSYRNDLDWYLVGRRHFFRKGNLEYLVKTAERCALELGLAQLPFQLTNTNWNQFMKKYKVVLVMDYFPLPWYKFWGELAQEVTKRNLSIGVARVDCHEQKELCRNKEKELLPRDNQRATVRLVWYVNGAPVISSGGWSNDWRGIEPTIEHAKRRLDVLNLAEYQVTLSESNFSDFVDNHKIAFVINGDPVQNRMAPIWLEFAKQAGKENLPVGVAWLDCGLPFTVRGHFIRVQFCNRLGIALQGPHCYENGRRLSSGIANRFGIFNTRRISTVEGIMEVVKQQLESEQLGEFQLELTTENWADFMAKGDKFTIDFVYLCSPTGLRCAATPQTWKTFAKEAKKRNLPIRVARVVCSLEKELCRNIRVHRNEIRWYIDGHPQFPIISGMTAGSNPTDDFNDDLSAQDFLDFATQRLEQARIGALPAQVSTGNWQAFLDQHMIVFAFSCNPSIHRCQETANRLMEPFALRVKQLDLPVRVAMVDCEAQDNFCLSQAIHPNQVQVIAIHNGVRHFLHNHTVDSYVDFCNGLLELQDLTRSQRGVQFHHTENGLPVPLTKANWNQFMAANEMALVLFDIPATWNVDGKEMISMWRNFSVQIKDMGMPVGIGHLNDEGWSVTQQVQRWPTLRWYHKGRPLFPQYQESHREIVRFLYGANAFRPLPTVDIPYFTEEIFFHVATQRCKEHGHEGNWRYKVSANHTNREEGDALEDEHVVPKEEKNPYFVSGVGGSDNVEKGELFDYVHSDETLDLDKENFVSDVGGSDNVEKGERFDYVYSDEKI